MKILIIGAGELGSQLAASLSNTDHDVTIIDASPREFDFLMDKLDVMTIGGLATDVNKLKQAGAGQADLVLAVSGDQSANVLACQIAKHLGARKAICRLYDQEVFSEADGVTPEFFGIDKIFNPPVECSNAVQDVLFRHCVLEQINFSHPEAVMVTALITADSPLNNVCIKDIPNTMELSSIRLAAIVRQHRLKIPHGNTTLRQGDRMYIAGKRQDVEKFLDCLTGENEHQHKSIVIAGTGRLSELIANHCLEHGMTVRVLVSSREEGEEFLQRMPAGLTTVCGSCNDEDVMREIQADSCDVFVSTDSDDENNILASILAKNLGARKVISITHKPEYISIVPAMDLIDCGFNSTLVSANAVFRLMGESITRIDSRLQSCQAYLTEFTVKPGSRLCGKPIKDCKLPEEAILALIFRGDEVLAPTGTTIIQENDIVAAIATSASEEILKPYFC